MYTILIVCGFLLYGSSGFPCDQCRMKFENDFAHGYTAEYYADSNKFNATLLSNRDGPQWFLLQSKDSSFCACMPASQAQIARKRINLQYKRLGAIRPETFTNSQDNPHWEDCRYQENEGCWEFCYNGDKKLASIVDCGQQNLINTAEDIDSLEDIFTTLECYL